MAKLSKRAKLISEKIDKQKVYEAQDAFALLKDCLLYTSPSPRDATLSRMPSSA